VREKAREESRDGEGGSEERRERWKKGGRKDGRVGLYVFYKDANITAINNECMCIYVYLHVYLYTYVYVYIHVNIYIYIYECVSVCVCMYVCVYIYLYNTLQHFATYCNKLRHTASGVDLLKLTALDTRNVQGSCACIYPI